MTITAPPPPSSSPPLSPEQIQTYLHDGILVVDNLLSPNELHEAHCGLVQTLHEGYGVDVHDLEGTAWKLVQASSTNGAGGVLDIFYPKWKMKIATNELLFKMTCQLWKEAYCCGCYEEGKTSLEEELASEMCDSSEFTPQKSIDSLKVLEKCSNNEEGADESTLDKQNGLDNNMSFKWHPFGKFDCNKGYMYIDRIGYRIPTELAKRIGKQIHSNPTLIISQSTQQSNSNSSSFNSDNSNNVPQTKKKKQKPRPIQRSLTPHFDCCPETYHDATTKNKWRPIQCFVSLTDNLLPNTGGFEAVPGFHREFGEWVKQGRRQSSIEQQTSVPCHPKPCVGEYTHLSPSHDRDIMKRIQHIPVRAGSVVFWDNRIPHGNAYRNDPPADGATAAVTSDLNNEASNYAADDYSEILGISGSRAVVYCSFLPDVAVNRIFVKRQLHDWKMQRPPRVGDRWIRQDDEVNNMGGNAVEDACVNDIDRVQCDEADDQHLSELGKRLIGLVKWA